MCRIGIITETQSCLEDTKDKYHPIQLQHGQTDNENICVLSNDNEVFIKP